ncbi:hypothetical protein ABEF95_007762 [Exophiala dermatitidis]
MRIVFSVVMMTALFLSLLLHGRMWSFALVFASQSWAYTLPEFFDWDQIEPTPHLNYTSCYDGLECSRLLVPLDWQNSTTDKQVTLAVARLAAKVDPSDPSFGGTIIVNPGGPGDSGVDKLRWSGAGIQEIVDGEKHFEILSFDPRGVHHTTPAAVCFEDDGDRSHFETVDVSAGSVTDSASSLNTKWALAAGLGKLCSSTGGGFWPDGTDIRQYVSTLQVAYDMRHLTEVIEEARNSSRYEVGVVREASQQILKTKPKPLLNYWGFSYGTYLGNTFASMFPDRIGRMILDGVLDASDYTATSWRKNLQDNNKLWIFFHQWCFDAGPRCALYDNTTKEWTQIASKVNSFLNHLQSNPLSIVSRNQIQLVRYYDIENLMHRASYGPWQVWPRLARGLAALMEGDMSTFTSLFALDTWTPHPGILAPFHLLDPFNNHSSPHPPLYPAELEASVAIMCGDGEDITSGSKTEYLSYVDELLEQSQLVGPVWAEVTLRCRNWPKSARPSAKNRFTGPFGSKAHERGTGQDDGTGLMLFIGNTADPVTPVRNAIKMAEAHDGKGVRVLVQETPGHCSGVNIPSQCTWGVINRFFNKAELPEKGKTCGVDWKPWDRI